MGKAYLLKKKAQFLSMSWLICTLKFLARRRQEKKIFLFLALKEPKFHFLPQSESSYPIVWRHFCHMKVVVRGCLNPPGHCA